jgi:hypothetical protein
MIQWFKRRRARNSVQPLVGDPLVEDILRRQNASLKRYLRDTRIVCAAMITKAGGEILLSNREITVVSPDAMIEVSRLPHGYSYRIANAGLDGQRTKED